MSVQPSETPIEDDDQPAPRSSRELREIEQSLAAARAEFEARLRRARRLNNWLAVAMAILVLAGLLLTLASHEPSPF